MTRRSGPRSTKSATATQVRSLAEQNLSLADLAAPEELGSIELLDREFDAGDERRLLRQAQELARVGSWRYSIARGRFEVSAATAHFLGIVTPAGQDGYLPLQPHMLDERISDEHRAMLRDAVFDLIRRGGVRLIRFALQTPGGGQRWFDARMLAEADAAGRALQITGTCADVSEMHEAERELRQAHAELERAAAHHQAVIAATPDAIHILDLRTGEWSRANTSGGPLVGFTEPMVRVLSGVDVEELVPAADRRDVEEALAKACELPDLDSSQARHRVLESDGSHRWLVRRFSPFARDDSGKVVQLLVVSRDLTDLVEMQQRLAHAALHDELTGLPNRRILHDRVTHALSRAQRSGHVALLMCDLDGFKRFNDLYGHGMGDQLLIAVADRISRTVRGADTLARMNADQFVVVVDVPDDQDPAPLAAQIAERIVNSLDDPIDVDGHEHGLSVSVGIAVADEHATPETLLRDADSAMFHVKSSGGNGHTFFEPAHRRDAAADEMVERAIRHALAGDGVVVHYQPIVDPRTEEVRGVEALVRVCDDNGAVLNTAHVIEVAERTGLIAQLDERVLNLACGQAAAWRTLPGRQHLTLKVNRSARDIARRGFYDRVSSALEHSGLEPAALTLEITETVLLDASPATLAGLWKLRERGVGLAIDDFGTGYASLRYLAELPITCIKIDRSFVNELPDDPKAATLVRTTIRLAEQLGMSCIVEGVETARQLAALSSFPQVLIQGYVYSRPQPPVAPPPTRISAPAPSGTAGLGSA